MRAAWYEKNGPAREVLCTGGLPKPQPAAGEVLVRLHFSGVNPTDVKRRAGERGPLQFARAIPGFDGAGIIEAVGEDVSPTRVGERVWIWEAHKDRWTGSAAEFAVVRSSRAVSLPGSASFETGAALGVPALTAWRALSMGGDLQDRTVLVTGAAGAVGHCAVQLARHMGAEVIATVRGQDRRESVRAAGASHIVDPTGASLKDAVLELTSGRGADHMVDVDLGAHVADAWRYVALNGSIASYASATNPAPVLPFVKYMYRNISLHGVAVFEIPEAAKLNAVAVVQDALSAGALSPNIDRIYALDDIAGAHEHQESGQARGKILIRLE